jgi:iron complex outermembrane receptor protein
LTSGTTIGDASLYAFGTYGSGKGVGDFNYRGPVGNYASLFKPTTAFPGWTLLSVYPTGFTPHFGSKDEDMSLVVGAKGALGDVKLDLSVGTGSNRINYVMTNSINASLGPKSPTSFDDGTVKQDELNINLDGSLPLTAGENATVFAFGAEYRREKFTIQAGDEASYAFGPGAYGTPALSCCSSGFPGTPQ